MNKIFPLRQSLKFFPPNLTNPLRISPKLTWCDSFHREKFPLVTRNFQSSNVNYKEKKERTLPTLICLQNPITWFMNKLDFKVLKSAWDNGFEESEFKRGSKQAVSVICCLLSQGLWDNLRGLVTKQALIRLQRDVEMNWSDEQKQNMCIEPSDIKLAAPKRVHFLRISDQRFADIDMMFLVLKFKEKDPSPLKDIVFIEMFARFHRNYTVGQIPNWTVSLFKVLRFTVYSELTNDNQISLCTETTPTESPNISTE